MATIPLDGGLDIFPIGIVIGGCASSEGAELARASGVSL